LEFVGWFCRGEKEVEVFWWGDGDVGSDGSDGDGDGNGKLLIGLDEFELVLFCALGFFVLDRNLENKMVEKSNLEGLEEL
jgi:hypothetical protein